MSGRTVAAALAVSVLAAGLLAWTGSWQALPDLPGADVETLRKARLMEDLMWGKAPVGGPFTLTDHTGTRRSLSDYRGNVVLLYFGYTFCPDVCPTDLLAMVQAVDRLGAAGGDVRLLFVTIDPERDTVAHLAQYIPSFSPRLVGLTGSPEEIRQAADAWKAYYRKEPGTGGAHYLLEHSAFTYVVGRDGRYAGFFPPGTTPERIVEIVRPHLANAGS